MKKILSGFLAIMLACTLTACGKETHDLQIGQVLGAAHGTKCFTVTTVVLEGETIVDVVIDEFQYMDSTTTTGVPNSENFKTAEGYHLVSKVENNTVYSQNMATKGGATMEIAAGYKAIEDFCIGKTAADLEGVDTVSGATLTDTAGYVAEVAKAAKAAAETEAVTYEGSIEEGALKVVLGAAHGTKCFTLTAAYAVEGTVVLSYIDEFQYMDPATTTGVPNAENFASYVTDGTHLVSKRVNNETYSNNMATKGGATMKLADGYDAIQNFCNGSAVADLEGVDAVSGCTLVDTAGYVAEIVKAAK